MLPREKGFVLWGHCQNLLDDPRIWVISTEPFGIIDTLFTETFIE